MESPCYCCMSSTENIPMSNQVDIDMTKLNAALQELGMLSSVTESRKQYLQEKAQSQRWTCRSGSTALVDHRHRVPPCLDSGPISGGFCVLQMNAEYVTNLLGCWNVVPGDRTRDPAISVTSGLQNSQYKYSEMSLESHSQANRVTKIRASRNQMRFQKPYVVPRRQNLEDRFRTQSLNHDSDSSRDSGFGNWSNASSSDKQRDMNATTVPQLPRSRSLDDLAFPVVECETQNFVAQKREIETMSQRMEHLHVI